MECARTRQGARDDLTDHGIFKLLGKGQSRAARGGEVPPLASSQKKLKEVGGRHPPPKYSGDSYSWVSCGVTGLVH